MKVYSDITQIVGNTPLVELQRVNPNPKVRLFGKAEGNNPGSSVKDRAAKFMMEGAVKRGELRPGVRLIEPTSGNTGIALAMIAATMGYEIAGGVGAKLAAPDREVYVMVGDGSFQMMANEITTAVQEGIKLIVVVVDNKGYSSVGRVSEQVGAEGFGCHYRFRGPSGAPSTTT